MTVSKHYTEQVAGAGHMPMVTLLVWSSVIVQTRLHIHTVLHTICIVRYIIFLYNYRFFCSFFVLYKIFCIVAYVFIYSNTCEVYSNGEYSGNLSKQYTLKQGHAPLYTGHFLLSQISHLCTIKIRTPH